MSFGLACPARRGGFARWGGFALRGGFARRGGLALPGPLGAFGIIANHSSSAPLRIPVLDADRSIAFRRASPHILSIVDFSEGIALESDRQSVFQNLAAVQRGNAFLD